jgi:peptidyl-prolyl cis-trans isomerase D
MLQIIRSAAASIAAKILFLILVVAFAVWGVGDYSWIRPSQPAPITVAGNKITADELKREHDRDVQRAKSQYRAEVARMNQQIPGLNLPSEMPEELLQRQEIAKQTVERVVSKAVLDETVKRYGLVVSDDAIRSRIHADPTFHLNNQFNADYFQRLLRDNSFTEASYVQTLRGDLARGAIMDAVTSAIATPNAVADRLYRARAERRRGTALFVDATKLDAPAAPSDAEIQAAYESGRKDERYNEPEFRSGIALRIGMAAMIANFQATPEMLKEEYDQHRQEFTIAEKRDIEVLRFADDKAAAAARARIDSGEAFAALAKEFGQSEEDVIRYEKVTGPELPTALRDPVFKLGQGKTSDAIVTPLGTFVARIVAIEPGRVRTLDEVRDQLIRNLAARDAEERSYKLATAIEDALGARKSLADAAKELGLETAAFEASARGADRNGQALPLFAEAGAALRIIFETPQGGTTSLIEVDTRQSRDYMFATITQITPAQAKPLEAVREAILTELTRKKRDDQARERAQDIVKQLASGTTLDAAASALGATLENLAPARRDGSTVDQAKTVPAAIASRLFQLKPAEIATAPGADGHYIIRLEEIVPADPATDEAKATIKRIAESLGAQFGGELGLQFTKILRTRYGAEVAPDAAAKLGGGN